MYISTNTRIYIYILKYVFVWLALMVSLTGSLPKEQFPCPVPVTQTGKLTRTRKGITWGKAAGIKKRLFAVQVFDIWLLAEGVEKVHTTSWFLKSLKILKNMELSSLSSTFLPTLAPPNRLTSRECMLFACNGSCTSLLKNISYQVTEECLPSEYTTDFWASSPRKSNEPWVNAVAK